ncbi:hypothetical protein J3F83DRAFT_737084 [Trichoderma novae-zelandiae]
MFSFFLFSSSSCSFFFLRILSCILAFLPSNWRGVDVPRSQSILSDAVAPGVCCAVLDAAIFLLPQHRHSTVTIETQEPGENPVQRASGSRCAVQVVLLRLAPWPSPPPYPPCTLTLQAESDAGLLR